MRHTESDLRTLLDEHGRAPAGREPAAPLDAIVRRGRRMRRTRRAMTAGAAVACTVAAVALGNAMLAGHPRADRTTVAAQPTGSVQAAAWPKLPDRFPVMLGAEKFDLRPIHAWRFETMSAGQTLTFTPTSSFTGIKVACDDPRAWVVVAMPLKGGETGGTTGRCGDSAGGGHHDRKSAPSGWLKGPQSIRIWVFPADAPVREAACRVVPKECDEPALAEGRALRRPEVRDQLSAMVGERPGRWAAGIYDRAEEVPPAPDGEPLADFDDPFEGTSTPAG
ncbi:hypothetical protein [Microbispora sp. H10836]|uniref:hypothetical protein n=1 Tax=Microbispora sp. H10836 TaxID=2729106 RepID=UPI001475C039|nr:hypothetical protein [Microbispora sp. H10836]